MKIALAADHRGHGLKNRVAALLTGQGHQVIDMGTNSSRSCDYPDFGYKVAKAVAGGSADRGILVCGTGIGMSIVANKQRGIRAALCHDTFSGRRARQHTDANVLCLGAWAIGQGVAREILEAFLEGRFEGGRHARRVDKITAIEAKDP